MVAVFRRGNLPTQAEFQEAIANRSACWYAACLRITGNAALAEDAVQDALLSAWQKRDQFHGDARLETWIHRIAVNAALQLLRKCRPGTFEPLPADLAGSNDCPQYDAENRDLDKALDIALARLTEFERACFVLKHLEQWRLKEIAAELGSNVSGVKQGLFRGVRKLRTTMADIRSQPA